MKRVGRPAHPPDRLPAAGDPLLSPTRGHTATARERYLSVTTSHSVFRRRGRSAFCRPLFLAHSFPTRSLRRRALTVFSLAESRPPDTSSVVFSLGSFQTTNDRRRTPRVPDRPGSVRPSQPRETPRPQPFVEGPEPSPLCPASRSRRQQRFETVVESSAADSHPHKTRRLPRTAIDRLPPTR